MTRDEFYQLALLRFAEQIFERMDKQLPPEEIAKGAGQYAEVLTNKMLAGLTELDLEEETSKATPVSREAPTLYPVSKAALSHAEMPSCPQCGCKMALRSGRYGRFWGCMKFPLCKGIVRIEGEKDGTEV